MKHNRQEVRELLRESETKLRQAAALRRAGYSSQAKSAELESARLTSKALRLDARVAAHA